MIIHKADMSFYALFHLNLLYSSIEEEDRMDVINRCYWPLLELIEDGIPLSIEISGKSLELVSELSPQWTAKFKSLLHNQQTELIGSGYIQNIAPLMPAKVNLKNQQLGLQVYKNLLEYRPEVALINEMAYSKGILEHYITCGYKMVVFDWNNAWYNNSHWPEEMRYNVQTVTDVYGRNIQLLWADSVAFQKFQRVIHGQLSLKRYEDDISRLVKGKNGLFPLYSNDAEVFNFRPGRYHTEGANYHEIDEWKEVSKLLKPLKSTTYTVSMAVKKAGNHNHPPPISIESAGKPIVVKKQEKYNIMRWALSGRDDLGINSRCFKIFNTLVENDIDDAYYWQELCYLWASDFRTHITELRWLKYLDRLSNFEAELSDLNSFKKSVKNEAIHLTKIDNSLMLESDSITLSLNPDKGLTFESVVFKNISAKPLLGTLHHGYYKDISLGADFYSGHCVIEQPARRKLTDLANSDCTITKYGINQNQKDGNIEFSSAVSINKTGLQLSKNVRFPQRGVARTHIFNFTFICQNWDMETLYYAVHNGGSKLEKFRLTDEFVEHSKLYSILISAKNGLGASEGEIVIGDRDKALLFKHNPAEAALIPQITFHRNHFSEYFFRLQYSAQEYDETFVENENTYEIKSSLLINEFEEYYG